MSGCNEFFVPLAMTGVCNPVSVGEVLPDCFNFDQFGCEIVYTEYLNYIYCGKVCHQKILTPVMFLAQLFTLVWLTPSKPTNNPSTQIICLLGTPRTSAGSNNQKILAVLKHWRQIYAAWSIGALSNNITGKQF